MKPRACCVTSQNTGRGSLSDVLGRPWLALTAVVRNPSTSITSEHRWPPSTSDTGSRSYRRVAKTGLKPRLLIQKVQNHVIALCGVIATCGVTK